MASNPVEAEATGQEFVDTTFRGESFRVVLDVDCWPVHLVRNTRGMRDGQVVTNPSALVQCLRMLLGEQWPTFLRVATKRKHLVEASNVFADAVGIPADIATDIVFGGVPRLLLMIDTWPEKVESDLSRFWNVDYRHRFLFQGGRRRLTLRAINARLSNLPVDSSLAIALNHGKLHKTGTELVLMDLFEAQTGRRHPSRPMSAAEIAVREADKAAEDKARDEYKKRMAKANPRAAGLEAARANSLISQGKSV